MRKFLIPALLIGATAITATPAAAQYRNDHRNDYRNDYRADQRYRSDDRIDHQLRQIEERIRHAARNGAITRREADRLLRQADQLDRLEDRYSRNGLTQWEARDLRNRLQQLRAQLRFERQDGRRGW